MRRLAAISLLILGALCGCMGPRGVAPAKPAAGDDVSRDERLAPVVFGTEDLGPRARPGRAARPTEAGIAPAVRVDQKARTVRIPARFTRATGVVEWLLSAGAAHPTTSALVTDCPVRDVAAGLAKIGLVGGRRPQLVGEDRAGPPSGPVVAVDVVIKDAAGKELKLAASRFLSARSDGPPLGEGAWVYVGPQEVREGGATTIVTELTGSLITTNLRDSSAIIYWAAKTAADPAPYVSACYSSGVALPGPDAACEVEIRPAQ